MGFYIVFVPMPQISVLYPVAYTTDISLPVNICGIGTGYNADIHRIGTNTVSADIRGI